MSHRCVEVSHGIPQSCLLSVWSGAVVDCHCRNGEDVKPAASQTYIERGPARDDRSFELEAAVEKADVEGTVICVHVTLTGSYVRDGGKLSTEPGGETAFVEVKIVYHLRVERGDQACHVGHLIKRYSVQKKEVVAAVSSVNI